MQGLSRTGSDLPEDMVLEILSKLPVKSLTRFRCVCKPWSSSFQTPRFITEHHNNNLRNNNLNLLLKGFQGNTRDGIHYIYQLSTEKGQNFSVEQKFDIPFFEKGWGSTSVDGLCNGILCLCNIDDKLALWNPSTRDFKILPQSSVQRPPSVGRIWFGWLGFGYDSQTDDYKVVRFVTNIFEEKDEEQGSSRMLGYENQVELYSLRSDSWKEIPVPEPEVSVCGSHSFNNYVNGFCYWLARGAFTIIYRLILSFDMINEKFSILPLPEFDRVEHFDFELLDFYGLFGVIFFESKGTEKSFDLWVMNGSWTKLFTIESVPGVERPLWFWKNGELFLERSDHELVLFDSSARQLKNLDIHYSLKKMQIIAYAESLVPINGRSEYEEHIIRWPVGGTSN